MFVEDIGNAVRRDRLGCNYNDIDDDDSGGDGTYRGLDSDRDTPEQVENIIRSFRAVPPTKCFAAIRCKALRSSRSYYGHEWSCARTWTKRHKQNANDNCVAVMRRLKEMGWAFSKNDTSSGMI